MATMNSQLIKDAVAANPPTSKDLFFGIDDKSGTFRANSQLGVIGSLVVGKPVPDKWRKKINTATVVPGLMPILVEYGFESHEQVSAFASGYQGLTTTRNDDNAKWFDLGASLA